MRNINIAIINKVLEAKHFKIVLLRHLLCLHGVRNGGPRKNLANKKLALSRTACKCYQLFG